MSGLPETNARLLSITGGGSSEDYGTDPAAGVTRWEGSEGGYVVERVLTDTSGQTLTLLTETRLVVPIVIGVQREGTPDDPKKVRQGDTVVYSQDGVTHSRTVRDLEEHAVAGTLRLYLESA